jgi:hypothetical protein
LSRAYYATFGAAWHALPVSLQIHVGRGRVHQETWTRYAASTHPPNRQIGGAGMRLRLLRHEADYQASVTFTAGQLRHALDEARAVIRLLDEHGYRP